MPSPRSLLRRVAPFLLLTVAIAGCSSAGAKPPSEDTKPTRKASAPRAHQLLSGRAAAAIDKVYSAEYRYIRPDGGQAIVRVTKGSQVTRLDIVHPGDAATLAHTLTMFVNPDGTYRCISTPSASGCALVAAPGAEVPEDPKLQHVFTDWLPTLADRSSAFSVQEVTAADTGLAGVTGSCFSLEQVTSSVRAPLDLGIYCFDEAGLLTGFKTELGVLTLVTSGSVPETIALPAPITSSVPTTVAPPPQPSPSPSVTPTP